MTWRHTIRRTAFLLTSRTRSQRRRPSTARRSRSAEAGRRLPRRHRIPLRPGGQPQQPRHPAVGYGQAVGSGGRVPQGDGDPAEAGRRQPRRHRIPQRLGSKAAPTSAPAVGGKPSEAEAEFRKAIALLQKLADDNPAVTRFRQVTGRQPQRPRWRTVEDGQADGGGGRVPRGDRDPGEGRRRRPQGLFHRDPLRISQNFGRLLLKLGRPAEALDAYGRAFTLLEQLIKENPADKGLPI